MRINSIKIGQEPEIVIHNKTLIDFITDEYKDRPHYIFKASADKCSVSNLIDIKDKEEFIHENDCEYTVIETPGFSGFVLIVAAVVAVAAAVYVYFALKDIQTDQGQGANNSLQGRQNKERPLQRIEDIAGKVRSYPTLIQEVYRKFNDSKQEVEYSLMCISKGEGEVSNVKDSETLLRTIPGAGAMFYGPNRMASVDTPFLTVGSTFNEPVEIIIRSNEVSGDQTLNYGEEKTLIEPNGGAEAQAAVGTDLGRITIADTLQFGIGKFLKIQNEDVTQIVLTMNTSSGDISGTYDVVGYEDVFKTIVLDAPGGGGVNAVNANWANIVGSDVNIGDAVFTPSNAENLIILGPYFLSQPDRTKFYANYVAANGLQNDDKDPIQVEIQCEYAQADDEGNMIGPWSTPIITTIRDNTKDRIGVTEEVTTTFTGPCLVRFRRITDEIGDAQRQDIKLDALYSVSPVTVANFGDVTTVQTRTIANSGSTQIRERKFNCEFERKLNVITPEGTLGSFEPTKRFIDYYAYAALDPRIGRRQPYEVNLQELNDKYNELVAYFGSDEAGEFNYTFDSDQVSFQETLRIVCDAAFGRAVRRGGVLSYRPELPAEPSTIFTHRNKIPEQQTITREFKSDRMNDGVELQYADPITSEAVTINIPQDGSALRPEKVEARGVRNHNQAWWQAWRRYNKQLYQRIGIKDTFTAEGALLSIGDVVSITNNTKINSFGGDVLAIQGLVVKLSEPVEFTDGDTHSIAFRLRNGTIDVIACDPGPTAFDVVLQRAPVEELYTGYNQERTKYIFSADQKATANKYLITEVDRQNTFEVPITAINYADEYYQNDGEQSPNN